MKVGDARGQHEAQTPSHADGEAEAQSGSGLLMLPPSQITLSLHISNRLANCLILSVQLAHLEVN